jgi:hypothetical protein
VLSSVGPELDLGQVESDVATLERELPDHAVAERWRRVLTGAG